MISYHGSGIKIQLSYHYSDLNKKTDDTNYWQGGRETGTFLNCQECKMVQLWRPFYQFLIKLNIL